MNRQSGPLADKATRTTDFWRRQQPARRILLVRDNDQLRQLMASWLVCYGYHVDTASDIQAAWKAIRTNSYDLLITDHNPPKFSGVELVNWVRSAQMTLPAIVLAEKLNPEELNQNQRLQSQWFQLQQFAVVLRKPFTTDEFTKALNQALGLAGNLRSHNGVAIPARPGNPSRVDASTETAREEKQHPNSDKWHTVRPVNINPA